MMERWLNKIICGDCLDVMREMPDNSIDAIVTDPPYGLKFMSKEWDHGIPGIPFWQEALRVCKPGAHLLAFGGTRTHHRLMVAIEDAGWEIRDCLGWLYGSGFPKSLDVSKAIDRAAGVEREILGKNEHGSGPHRIKLDNHGPGDTGIGYMDGSGKVFDITAPATDSAKQWQGWGTALKPAWEPIVLARKPVEGTVAENVQKWGVGALNIDGCRVETEDTLTHGGPLRTNSGDERNGKSLGMFQDGTKNTYQQNNLGRFPANILHDGSEEAMEVFPYSISCNTPSKAKPKSIYRPNQDNYQPQGCIYPGDSGSASRFFYCAKASPSERGEGNTHPTVKPIALIKYLIKLITPPNGIVLDMFAGSGTTGIAAIELGFNYFLIDNEQKYIEIAEARISKATEQMRLFI